MTAPTKAQVFAKHKRTLRGIASSLGRADIFDRDLRGEGGEEGVAAGSDEAIDTAVGGVGWYLDEEHECDGEIGFNQDPRTTTYFTILREFENAVPTKNAVPQPNTGENEMTVTRPADLTSPTGYCTHRNHKKCPYRPGGATENGIALSDGGFYMCPCSCHMSQKHVVQGKRLQVSLDARKAAIAATEKQDDAAAQEVVTGNPDPAEKPKRQSTAAKLRATAAKDKADAVAIRTANKAKAAKAAKASPKSTESTPQPKAGGKATTATAAPKAAKEGLTTAEKREVRIRMAAVLREMGERNLPGKGLSAREMAYVEAHWLKYIDPDLDKARRDAAAAK